MSFVIEFSDFCNDFKLQTDGSPSYIYHYTSPVGAMGVIENNTLRFTDRNYLNDYSEGMYTLDLCLENLNDLTEEGKFRDYIRNSLEERKKNPNGDEFYIYQCSFSTNKDSLCLWNYYTKDNGIKGYNLKFNREKVEDDTIRPEISDKSGKIEKLRLHSGSIIYDKDKQIEILKNVINKFQNYLEINNFERYEEFAAPWIIDRIFLQGVFFKKPCFKVEEEYRIAINQRIGENGASIKAKRKFMERNGIFIPYIDLPFNKDAVEGITISPTLDYENTRNGVLSMTAKKYRNVNKDNIVKSYIPVRY